MILRELITKLGFDVDKGGLDDLDKTVDGITQSMQGIADKSIKVGKSLTAKVTLPLLAIGAGFIKAASDAEETEAKFGTVFQDVSNSAEQTANDLAKSFGLSSVKSKELLSDTGDLLTGFGFTGEKALELSKGVNELAVDLASFTNFQGGAEGASRALTKALLGEREGVKSLGISIQSEDIKKQIAINKTKGLTFETLRQAQAFATLQLAQKQSKNAIGDFARTNQGFANQMRILKGELFDLAVQFGKILLPVAQSLVRVVRSIVGWFKDLSPEFKTIIVFAGALAAAIGPLLIGFGLLIKTVLAAKAGFALLGITGLKSFALLALPLLKIVAIGALIALVFEDILAFFNGKDSVTGVIIDKFGEAFDFLDEKFKTLPGFVKVAIQTALTPFRVLINTIQGLGAGLGTLAAGGGFKNAAKAFAGEFKGTLDVIGNKDASLTDSLGFGDENLGRPSPSAVSSTRGGDLISNITAPINISVPEGTTPDQVGPAVQKGVSEGIGVLLRETKRQTQGAVVN